MGCALELCLQRRLLQIQSRVHFASKLTRVRVFLPSAVDDWDYFLRHERPRAQQRLIFADSIQVSGGKDILRKVHAHALPDPAEFNTRML